MALIIEKDQKDHLYAPFCVYDNLVKMLERYRGAKLDGYALSEKEVAEALIQYEYVIMNAAKAGMEYTVFLIAPNSPYADKSMNFKKLLRNFPAKKPDIKQEVMFVTERIMTIHLKKQIEILRTENPTIYIEDHVYTKFLIEIPRHVSVPEHLIATDAEIHDYCTRNFTTKEKFPKLLTSDPMCVWIGARPGQVVRINRLSETAGKIPIYRYVK